MAEESNAAAPSALRSALGRLRPHPNRWVNQMARRMSPSMFLKVMDHDVWSIGVMQGLSPFELAAPPECSQPILTPADITDVPAVSLAQPFAVRWDGQWHLFFTVVNGRTAKGEIALATSPDLCTWDYRGVVLAEPFHLSYPCVFAWDDTLYMVPETWEAGAVRLYRAVDSPQRWEFVTELLRGPVHLDATPVHHDDRWWLFAETNPLHHHDTLRLYTAPTLDSAWAEHPASPIVAGDPRIARPAGRVVRHRDALVRYTKDCSGAGNGGKLRAFEIHELTDTRYAERQVDLWVRPAPWAAFGMRHIDTHELDDSRWVAFVDGS